MQEGYWQICGNTICPQCNYKPVLWRVVGHDDDPFYGLEYVCEKCGKKWEDKLEEIRINDFIVKKWWWFLICFLIGFLGVPLLILVGLPLWASLIIVGETSLIISVFITACQLIRRNYE